MSAGAASASGGSTAKMATKASAWSNLRGLVPYLARYKSAIAFGLLTLLLMGLIGNIVPLATGIITDSLAGSPRPFLHPEQAERGAGPVLGGDWLSRLVPYSEPRSRRTLAIYCLILVAC